MSSCEDRAAGVIVGLAVGDKNLGPIHMAVMVGESLQNNQKFDKVDIYSSYLKWFSSNQTGSDDTGVVGYKVFKNALPLFSDSKNKEELITKISQEVDTSLKGMTAGINPSHRSTPLSMAKFITNEQLIQFSKEECEMTHQNIYAQEASMISNIICRKNIEGQLNFQQILECLRNEFKFEQLIEDALKTPSSKFKPSLDNGGFSPKTLETALCFVEKYTKDVDFQKLDQKQRQSIFESCMNECFKFAGKPNYSPVLVGSIMGSIVGASGIPQTMYSHCPCISRVLDVSRKLGGTWKE